MSRTRFDLRIAFLILSLIGFFCMLFRCIGIKFYNSHPFLHFADLLEISMLVGPVCVTAALLCGFFSGAFAGPDSVMETALMKKITIIGIIIWFGALVLVAYNTFFLQTLEPVLFQ